MGRSLAKKGKFTYHVKFTYTCKREIFACKHVIYTCRLNIKRQISQLLMNSKDTSSKHREPTSWPCPSTGTTTTMGRRPWPWRKRLNW